MFGISLRTGNLDAAEQAFEAALAEGGTPRLAGSVALVGCGDGDPGLLGRCIEMHALHYSEASGFEKLPGQRTSVGGQWRLKSGGGYDLVVVENGQAPNIPLGGEMEALS